MNKLIALVLIGVVLANDYELLDQMNQYEFGKTIIATLQIELESGDNSIDNVVNELRLIQSSAEQDLKENNQNIQERMASCGDRESDLQSVIQQANQRKADDERSIPLKQEELQAKQQQLKDKSGQEQRNIDRIALLENIRNQEKEQYNVNQKDSTDLIAGLKKAKGIISQLKSTFLQTSEVKQTLDNHVQQLNQNSPYFGLIQMLTKSADSEQTLKVVQIMDELVDSLQNMQSAERNNEESKQKLFQLQKARYELENKSLEGSLAQLKSDTLKIEQTLLELQNDIASKSQLLIVKSTELKDWQKTCDDDLKNSQTVRTQKNEELNIINQTLEIFSSRFNQGIRSYIQKLQI